MTVDVSTSRLKALVQEFFDHMNGGDIDGAFTLLADDCSWFSLSSRQFSDKEHMRGLIRRVNNDMLRAPIEQRTIVFTAEANRVAVVSEGVATTVSGVAYQQMYHFLFEFEGEAIVRLWEFNDTHHAREVFALSSEGKVR
jgi:ketosteroid isomerase-like protein